MSIPAIKMFEKMGFNYVEVAHCLGNLHTIIYETENIKAKSKESLEFSLEEKSLSIKKKLNGSSINIELDKNTLDAIIKQIKELKSKGEWDN